MVDTTLGERIARIEKELVAIRAEVEAERQEESSPEYRLCAYAVTYKVSDLRADKDTFPDLIHHIDTGTKSPTIAAFRDKETADRVLAFLNQVGVPESREGKGAAYMGG